MTVLYPNLCYYEVCNEWTVLCLKFSFRYPIFQMLHFNKQYITCILLELNAHI